jgi:hypothetical protein
MDRRAQPSRRRHPPPRRHHGAAVTGTAPLTTRTGPPTRLRLRRRRRWPRRVARSVVVLLLVAVLPVPWLHHVGDDPPGFAWRLSGRLHVEDQVVDPPGRWTWLTVGRPPVLGELAWGYLRGDPPGRDLRAGPADRRPRFSDPSAAAVGSERGRCRAAVAAARRGQRRDLRRVARPGRADPPQRDPPRRPGRATGGPSSGRGR